MIVYAVVFGHHPTAEVVLALYDNEGAAQAHADYENDGVGDWRVVRWPVASVFVEAETEA